MLAPCRTRDEPLLGAPPDPFVGAHTLSHSEGAPPSLATQRGGEGAAGMCADHNEHFKPPPRHYLKQNVYRPSAMATNSC